MTTVPHCLLPLQVLAFPVQMLIRFWLNHHLLDLVQRPCWRVVKGRSKTYVDRVLKGGVIDIAMTPSMTPADCVVAVLDVSVCRTGWLLHQSAYCICAQTPLG